MRGVLGTTGDSTAPAVSLQHREFPPAFYDYAQIFRGVELQTENNSGTGERSGAESRPARVVAPTKVKG